MSKYDMSLHINLDAKVWAEFFMKTKEENNWSLADIDESLMIGWFANAMMAMHDHLHNTKIEQLQTTNKQLLEALEYLMDIKVVQADVRYGDAWFNAEKAITNAKQVMGDNV